MGAGAPAAEAGASSDQRSGGFSLAEATDAPQANGAEVPNRAAGAALPDEESLEPFMQADNARIVSQALDPSAFADNIELEVLDRLSKSQVSLKDLVESARRADPVAFQRLVSQAEEQFPTSGKNRFASVPVQVREPGRLPRVCVLKSVGGSAGWRTGERRRVLSESVAGAGPRVRLRGSLPGADFSARSGEQRKVRPQRLAEQRPHASLARLPLAVLESGGVAAAHCSNRFSGAARVGGGRSHSDHRHAQRLSGHLHGEQRSGFAAARPFWISPALPLRCLLSDALVCVAAPSASNALAKLASLAAPACRVLRDGKEVSLPAEEVVPGDVVLLVAGNSVAADLRCFEVTELKTNEAILTGASCASCSSTGPTESGRWVVARVD